VPLWRILDHDKTISLKLLLAPPAPVSRPVAFAIARWQARTRESITNLRHESVRFPDPFARTLLTLLDGTRDRSALARAFAADLTGGDPATIAPRLDEALAMVARYGVLSR